MDRIPPSQVIQYLADQHDLCHPDGVLNIHQFARATGLSTTTISRLKQAGADWDMSRKVAQTLAQAFDISEAQARGYEPLETTENPKRKRQKPTQQDLDLLEEFHLISTRDQSEIRKYIHTLIKIKK